MQNECGMFGGNPSSLAASEGSSGWRSRGYLPHYNEPGLFQMLTLRLHDSLPASKLVEAHAAGPQQTPLRVRVVLEAYLDAGAGACYLRDPRIAALAQEALMFFDAKRYHLCAWVIMPNHLHVLAQFNAEYSVSSVMHSWKRFIARQANSLLARTGEFWQREYFDRYIRNEGHYRDAVKYIEWNPVQARLVDAPAKWPFSSAYFHTRDFG